MKYLKKFNESKSNIDDILKEVLSNPVWEKVEPEKEHWGYQLEYYLTDKVKIQLINFMDSDDFNYYLSSGDDFYFVSSYDDNITQLFSKYDSSYRYLSDYERMMKICKYLLPYFEKKPSDELIEDIRDCFIDIEDMFDGSEVKWGYIHNNEYPFFPAYKFSDKLGLFMIYDHITLDDELKNKLNELFEEGKRKLEFFDIHPSRANLLEMEWDGFMIGILF